MIRYEREREMQCPCAVHRAAPARNQARCPMPPAWRQRPWLSDVFPGSKSRSAPSKRGPGVASVLISNLKSCAPCEPADNSVPFWSFPLIPPPTQEPSLSLRLISMPMSPCYSPLRLVSIFFPGPRGQCSQGSTQASVKMHER